MPVPAGIRCPMMMFSLRPSRSSLAPRIAASVNTRVVSWNDAAEINDCVVKLAFVMPSNSGSRVDVLPPFFTARSLISLKMSLSTFSPSRNSVSPGSTTFTFCSIWRTITPMCLSLIFTPCNRYTSCTSFSRYSCTARGPLIRRMSCGFTGPSVSRSPARTRSPSCTRKCFPAGTSYNCASPSSGCTQISRLPRLISPNRTTPSTSEIVDGVVRFGEIKRGKREIWVHPEEGEAQLYEVPAGKHLRVHEGDRVRAGDRLTEGPVNPHDILRIKGPRAVQEYLLNEVQEVYRLQGVKINDKHIGVIVRQMLQKVKIVEPGDTMFLEGENIDKLTFREVNERLVKKGGKPATSEPLLLGITKASLTTQSFISAASFQETTRVLTDAAIRGAKDDLLGLKENIIIGHLIPAGTGIYRYHDIEIEPPEGFQPPPPPQEPVPGAVPSPFPEEVEAD